MKCYFWFNNEVIPRSKVDEEKTSNTYEILNALYECQNLTLSVFKSEIFPLKSTQGKGLPKQMLQRLPMDLSQVNASDTSEDLLNEIRHVIYCLYQEKKLLRKYIAI